MSLLTESILAELKKLGWTVAFAESLTAGAAMSTLAAQAGISEVFRGGVVTYDIPTKGRLLKVDVEFAESCNAVSERTAREMAVGAAELLQSDIAVTTTGYATPWEDKPLEAYINVYHVDSETHFSKHLDLSDLENRDERRTHCSQRALELLLHSLIRRF